MWQVVEERMPKGIGETFWPSGEGIATRHATGVWQRNWFSVAIGPVSKASQ